IKDYALSAVVVIRDVLKDLVKSGRLSSQEAEALAQAANAHDWYALRKGLDVAWGRNAGGAMQRWPQMTLNLLKQMDALHTHWTRARKLGAVARVIEGATDQPDTALERLTKLIDSWGVALPTLPADPLEPAVPGVAKEGPGAAGQASVPEVALSAGAKGRLEGVAQSYGSEPELMQARDWAMAQAQAWKQVAMRSVGLLARACGQAGPAAKEVEAYLKEHLASADVCDMSADNDKPNAARIMPKFIDLVGTVERQLQEDHKVRLGLQRLLAMLCDNMKALSPEEVWLTGQLEPIRALLAQPVGASALEQAQAQLAQVIALQSRARQGLQDAKIVLKEMLSTLINSIGSASQSTSTFYDQVGHYRQALEQVNDFDTLSSVIQGLLTDTANVRQGIEATRLELADARRKVGVYEARVQALERELSEVSGLVQKDPLTFVLNRRGLEEAFRVETARSRRYGSALTLVLMDVDDFKNVNDTLGHAAGDRALVHLAATLQLTLQPTDHIARYGGEEFALLLPVTELPAGIEVVTRLQAELARRPFQWQGQTLAMTFSAGVCQWRHDESLETCIERADAAMYEGKRRGKNCIVAAQ
ncbi:MAG TPA: GGDEF domain-containing protein, partial [Burkholderiaceae bacterium]|nr:GGDEF domain-containing protein [Burkholderiaceae bacterium]